MQPAIGQLASPGACREPTDVSGALTRENSQKDTGPKRLEEP